MVRSILYGERAPGPSTQPQAEPLQQSPERPQRQTGKQHQRHERMIPVIPTGSAFSVCTTLSQFRLGGSRLLSAAAERKNDLGRHSGANDQSTGKAQSAG